MGRVKTTHPVSIQNIVYIFYETKQKSILFILVQIKKFLDTQPTYFNQIGNFKCTLLMINFLIQKNYGLNIIGAQVPVDNYSYIKIMTTIYELGVYFDAEPVINRIHSPSPSNLNNIVLLSVKEYQRLKIEL